MNAPAKEYDGQNKYIRITDIDENSSEYCCENIVSPDGVLSDKYLVNVNDILFARTGSSTGKTYLYRPSDGHLYFAGFLIRANVKDDYDSNFIYYQCKLKRYWNWVRIMSARSGQPGINSQEYSTYTIYSTSKEEQSKISSLFKLLDERIATQRRLIEDFLSLRRAILQDVIKRGLSKKSWKFTTLNDILTERGEKNSNGYDVFSVSVSEGVVNQIEYLGRSFAAKETGHYNVARYGDIIYTKSPTGSFPYGIVKRDTQKEPAAISPLYGVFVPKEDRIGILLGYYFESEVNTFNYLHPIIQKGAKNTINITNSGFLANSVPLPTDESEALTLAKCLDTISNKIVLEKSVLAHYTEQREYLLSKMFV